MFHMYADDAQVTSKSFDLKHEEEQYTAKRELENGICEISTGILNNKLKIKGDKTEFLALTSKRNLSRIIIDSPEVLSDCIQAVSHAQNLGVAIDDHLSMENVFFK